MKRSATYAKRLDIMRALLAAGIALFSGPAWAASGTWSGASSAVWQLNGNWSGASFPATGDTATFNNAGNGNTTLDLGAGLTINAVVFDTANAAAYTLGTGGAGGQTLILNNGGSITMNNTVIQNQSVNAAITLGTDGTAATYTLANNTPANTLTFAGNMTGGAGGSAGVKTLSVTGTNSITISGVIDAGGASSLALTKTGTGSLTLTGANTYTGATTVNAGTLLLDFNASGSAADIINNTANSSTLVLGSGGLLSLKGKGATVNSQRFNGLSANAGGATITLTQNGATSLTLTLGAITRGSGATVNFSTAPTAAIIATTTTGNEGSGIIAPWLTVGSGTSLQYGANDGSGPPGQIIAYTGATADGGNLSSLVSSSVNYSFAAAATMTASRTGNTLRYTGGNNTVATAGYDLTLNGLMNAGSASTLTISGTGNLVIGANNELVITANAQNTTISCPIKNGTGLGSLTYAGSGGGTLTLSGVNTFSGDTRINAGTLSVGNTAALMNTSGIKLSSGATFDVNIASFDLSRLNPTNGGSGVVSGSTISIHQRPTTASPGTIYGTLLWDSNVFDWNSTFVPDFGQGALLRSTGSARSWQANMTFSGDTTIDSGPNQFNGNNNNFSVSTPGLKTLYIIGSQKVVLSALSDGVGQLRLVCNSSCYTVGGGGNQPNNASTFTGGTTINSGVLNIPNATSLGPATMATVTFGPNPPANTQMAIGTGATIVGLNSDPVNPGTPIVGAYNAATLTINNSVSNTFAGTMQNSGNTLSLTKGKPGALYLTGATRSYTGLTTVNGGTLMWGNTPNVAGALTVNAAGNFSLADGTVRATTCGTLTLASGATLSFDWINAAADSLTSSANITPAANTILAVSINMPGAVPSGGPLTLLQGAGGSTLGNLLPYMVNNNGLKATLATTATTLTATFVGTEAPLTTLYWQGNTLVGTSQAGRDNALALSDGTKGNWSSTLNPYTATAQVPGPTCDVIFSTTATPAQQTTVLGADLEVKSVTINDGTAVTIGGGTGGNSLTILGGGLTVSGTAANPTISSGLVLGAPQTWNVAGGKTLTVSGVVAGTNSMTKADAGILVLSNNNNLYTGATFIQAGVVQPSGNTTPFGIGGPVTFTGGTLQFVANTPDLGSRFQNSSSPIAIDLNNQSKTIATSIPAGNTGGLRLSTSAGTPTLTLTGAHAYTGDTYISNNVTLSLGNGGTRGSLSGVGNIVNNGTLIFNINNTLAALVQAVDFGAITNGTGGVTKNGTGAIVYTGTNVYSGTTAINNGTLALGSSTAFPGGALNIGSGSQNATLDLNGYNASVSSIFYPASTAGYTVLITGGGGTLTLNGNITTDSNAWGNNIIAGKLDLGGSIRTYQPATPGGSVMPRLTISANISNSGGGLTFNGGHANHTLTLSGNNTYTGTTTLSGAGALLVGSDTALGGSTLVFNGGAISSDSASPKTLANGFSFSGGAGAVFGQASYPGKLTFQGTVDLGAAGHAFTCNSDVQLDGQIIGAGGSFTKFGSGTLTITNPSNNFTGNSGFNGATCTGTLRWGASHVFPDAAKIMIGGTGVVDLNNYDDTVAGIFLGVANNGQLTSITTGTGTLTLNGDITVDTNCYGDKSISGNLNLGSATRTFNVSPNNTFTTTFTISANVSNGGLVFSASAGGTPVTTVVLSGANTYSSGTTINQQSGTLNVAVGTDSPGWPASGALGTGTVTFNGGGLCCDTNTPRTLPNGIAFTGNGTIGHATRNGKLTLSGSADLGASTRTLTVNSTVEFSNTISGSGAAGIVKAGKDTLILSGSNTYPGTTTVNANGGLLQYNAASAIAGAGRNITVTATSATVVDSAVAVGYVPAGSIQNDLLSRIVNTSTGTFALTADCSENFDYSAGGPGNNFTALFLGAATNVTATYSGTLTANGTTYRLGGGSGTLIVSSVLAGSGNTLTVSGPGTVKLNNASNTYKGTTVNAGALLYAMAAGALGDTTGSLTVNGILDLNGQTHTVGAVTIGSTGVIRNGTLIGSSFSVASGANVTATLQGNVNVTGGTLSVSNAITGTISLSGGNLLLAWDGDGTSRRQTNDFAANIMVNNSGSITVQKAGVIGSAANKTLTLGTLSIGGQTLTVVNNNSFGLGFTGTTTLTAGPTFNVPGGSSADVVQGLTLFGKVTGGFGFTKSTGTGTLVLDSASNDFGPGTLTINAGLVKVASDAALGNAGNIVSLNANGVGIQLAGTDTYAHQINTSAAGGVIDVFQGMTATVSSAFNAGAANANNLQKNGNGTLVLTADNTANYTGYITVNGGVLRVGHNGALGAGGTSGASYSECAQNNHAAIEIQAGVTTPEYFKIRTYGINSGGAVRAVGAGTATCSGTIEIVNDGSFGADTGATLDITGTYTGGSTHNHVGGGTIKISCPFSTTSNGLNMYGPGTTIHCYAGGTASQFNRQLNLYGGRTLTLQATSTAFKIAGGNTQFIVNSSTVNLDNVTLGAVANRLGGTAANNPQLEGATLNFIGGGAVGEALGSVTFNSGLTTLTSSGANAANILSFTTQTARNAGGVITISSAGSSSVRFSTTSPALNDSILPGYFVGNDFATHTGNNTPITAYAAYTTGDLGTTGAAANNFNPTGAQTPVTASKTINSLKLTGQGVTLNPGVALTLDTGMVINDGGGNITGGLLTPSTELIINNASAMTIGSVITSGQSITKLGAGTLTLSGTNTISGTLTVLGGSLALAGNNTLGNLGGGALVVNQNCTLDLGANNLYVANFSSTSLMDGNGGTVTGSGTLTVKPSGAVTFAGNVTGSLNFVKTGNQTLTLTSSSGTTGTLSILGGGLTLKDGGAFPNTTGTIAIRGAVLTLDNATVTAQTAKYVGDRINNSAITLDGGSIAFNGRQSTDSTETLGPVTAATDGNVFAAIVGGTGVNSAQLTLTSLTRTAGATLFFNQGQTSLGQAGNNSRIVVTGGLTGNLAPVNGVVPGAFYMVNTDNYYFLGYVNGLGFGPLDTVGFPVTMNNFITAGAADNVSDPSQNPCVVSANKTINSLKQGNISFSNGTPTGGSDLLTLASGMAILSVNTWGSPTQRGRITSGINELFLFKRDANVTPDPMIHTVIVDKNGGTAVDPGDKVSLVIHSQRQDRGYYVHLTAPNLYSGGTFVDVGPLNVAAAGLSLDATSAGIVTIPAGGLTINNNCLVDMTGASGQIEPSNVVTINGGGALNLMGANTLAAIVFNSMGGTVQPKVVPYNTITAGLSNALATYGAKTGTLTLTGSITCTPLNPAVTPLFDSGNLDLNGASAFPITVSALPCYPAGTGLQISSVIRNGGITKLGTGVLQLSGANTFTGGLTINAGAVLAVTSAQSIGATANPVTLANNAALWLSNTTIGNAANPITVAASGGTIAGVGGDGGRLDGTIVLNGPLTVTLADPQANSTDRTVTVGANDANTTITGTGSLVVMGNPGNFGGAKYLYLQNNTSYKNTYSGGTTIESGGRLRLNAAYNMGSLSATLTLNAGGALDLNNKAQTVGNFTGTGGIVSNNVAATAPVLTIGYGDAGGGNFQGVIAANGTASVALTKVGTGTITLSGTNTYTGATTMNAGILVVSGSLSGTSVVTNNAGKLKLDYSGSDTGKINDAAVLSLAGGTIELSGGTHHEIASSTTLSRGTNTVVQSSGSAVLRLGAITRSGANLGMINFGAASIASTSTGNDAAGILGAWATINGTDWACNSGSLEGGTCNYITAFAGGSYHDIAATGDTVPDQSTWNVRINSAGGGGNDALAAATTTINTLLQNTATPCTVDTAGKVFRTTGIMIGAGQEAITIGAAVGDGSLSAVTGGGDLALRNFNPAKLITVNAPVVANGASTLTSSGNVLLKGVNTYTGATMIGGGTLEIGAAGRLNSGTYSANISIGESGTLKINSSANQVLSGAGVISGPGGLVKDGSGTLDLQPGGANQHTYTGGTVVNGGILKISSNQGVIIGAITVNSGGTLEVLQANGLWSYSSITPARTLTLNGGTMSKTAAGTGNHDYSFASIDMTGGTISATAAGYYEFFNHYGSTLPVTTHASSTESVISANWGNRDQSLITFTTEAGSTPSGVDLVFSGLLIYNSSAYAVTKAGPGVLAITADHHVPTVFATGTFYGYVGATTISGGTLQLGNGGTSGSLNPVSPIVNSATLAFNRTDAALAQGSHFNSVISGTGGLLQRGSGKTTLLGGNTYSGVTLITNGTLNVTVLANGGAASSIGTASDAASLVINGGALQYTGGSPQTTDRAFTIGPKGATLDASGGLLTLASGGAGLAFVTNDSPAVLTLTGTGTGLLAGLLGDSGSGANTTSLVKTGAGTWTLTGTGTFSGNTTVSNGKLYLNAAVNSTPAIAVAAGGTLGGSGSANAATATAASGGIVEGGSGGAGCLTLGSLALQNGSAVRALNISQYGSSPAIQVVNSGGLGASGTVTVKLAGAAPSGSGTAHIIKYNGTFGGFAALTLDTSEMTGKGVRATFNLVDNSAQGYVDVSYTVDYPVWKGAGPGTWITDGPDNGDWRLATAPGTLTHFMAGDATLFDDTATGVTTPNISAADVSPGSVLVSNNSLAYTIQGSFGIAGAGPLIKRGTNTLTIANGGNNKFSGPMSVEDGAVAVSSVNNVSANGPLGNSALAVILGGASTTGTLQYTSTTTSSTKPFSMAAGGAGAFQVDDSNTVLTLSGMIDGSGELRKTGAGTLALTGAKNYGKTTVAAGTLYIATTNALCNGVVANWTPANITVDSGAILAFNVGGADELTVQQFTNLMDSAHLAGGSTTTGLKSGSFIGLDTANAGGSLTYGSVITNANGGVNAIGLVKYGNNTLTLTANNTYTAGTIVNGGTLVMSGSNNRITGGLRINPGGTAQFDAGWGQGLGAPVPARAIAIYGGLLTNSVGGGNSDYSVASVTMQGGTWSQTGAGYHDFFNDYGTDLPITTLATSTTAVITARLASRNHSTITFTTAAGTTPSGIDLLISGQLIVDAAYGIVKAGPGVLCLNGAGGACTYTGSTVVNGGTLLLDLSGALNNNILYTSSALTMGGGTLRLKGKNGTSASQTMASLTTTAGTSSTILLDPNGGTLLNVFITSATLTTGSGSLLTFDYSLGTTVGETPGNVYVRVSPSLVGTLPPNYRVKDSGGTGFAKVLSDGTVVRSGLSVLDLPQSGATSNFCYQVYKNAADTVAGSLNLKQTASQAAATVDVDTTALAGTVNLDAYVLSVGTVTIAGTNTFGISAAGGGLKALTMAGTNALVNNASGTVTVSAPVLDNLGSSLQVGGTGATVLGGTSEFSGAAALGSLVKLGSGGALPFGPLGTVAGATTVSSGGALDLNGYTLATAEPLMLNGTGVSGGGALCNSSSTAATYSGLLTLGSAASIVAGNGHIILSNAGTISGAFALTLDGTSTNSSLASIIGIGAGTLTKNGTGTWFLNGANTYTGTTTVNGGILALSGNNTCSGALTINAGTLRLGGAGSGANGPLGTTAGITTIAATGAALDLNGYSLVTAEPVTLNGSGVSNGGALLNSSASSSAAFSGPITLGSATRIHSTMAGKVLSLTGGIAGGGYGLTIGGAGDTTVSANVISGTGTTLTKEGAGTLTLVGVNTYTGATAVNGGVLNLSGSLSGGGAVTVGGASAAGTPTLAGNGTVGGAVTVKAAAGGAAGRLAPGSGGAGTLNTGSLTLQTGVFLDYNLDAPNQAWGAGSNDYVNVTGNLAIYPNLTVAVTPGSGIGMGVYHLVKYTGSLSDSSSSFSGWTVTGTVYTASFSVDAVNKYLDLTLASPIRTWDNNGATGPNPQDGPGTWDTSTPNWWTGAVNTNWNNATPDAALIGAGGTAGTITLNTPITVGGLTFAAVGGNYTVAGSTLTMAAGSSIAVNDDGAAISSTLAGGAVTKTGAGTLTLTGANTYTGATTIAAGTLSVNSIKSVGGGNSALGAPATAGNGTIAVGSTTNGATLTYTGTGDTSDRVLNLAGTTGGATLDQSGSGLLKFTSALTATGAGAKILTLKGSTAGTGELGGAVVNGSGTTSLIKDGTGTWTLSGVNTYSGGTTVSNGVLALGAAGTIASTNIAIREGATLDVTAKASYALAAANTYTITVSPSGSGSAGRINASGQTLDISNAKVAINVTGTLDDSAYVLADYGALNGAAFAATSGVPAGYTINYAYSGGTQIALTVVSGEDPDSDGIPTDVEAICGTDPNSAESVMKISAMVPTNGADIRLQFVVGSNRTVRILAANRPGIAKTVVGAVTNPVMTWKVTNWIDVGVANTTTQRFYSLMVTNGASGWTNTEEWAMYVQPRAAGQWYMAGAPLDFETAGENNLTNTLGAQLMRGLLQGGEGSADLVWVLKGEQFVKHWVMTNVWYSLSGTAKPTNTVISSATGFWVRRVGNFYTNTVFTGKTRTNGTYVVNIATNWNFLTWPFKTERAEGAGAGTADVGWGFRKCGGQGAKVSTNADVIVVLKDNAWRRYRLLDGYGASVNGHWWDDTRGGYADFTMQPGQGFYYYRRGTTGFVWTNSYGP